MDGYTKKEGSTVYLREGKGTKFHDNLDNAWNKQSCVDKKHKKWFPIKVERILISRRWEMITGSRLEFMFSELSTQKG